MGCFVHSRGIRRIVNTFLRQLRFEGLGFIAFSRGEADNLIQSVGIAADAVHVLLWRQELGGRVSADRVIDGDFVFSGGYSNRDYDLLMRAVHGEPYRVVIVASSRNRVHPLGEGQVDVLYDLPEAEFEARLAACRVVALPLRNVGEACGQSVLLRVLRNGKPLIATRHEAIEDYLGVDYPGFVTPNDIAAMRAAVRRAMSDASYRADLAAMVKEAAKRTFDAEPPGAEIHRFLIRDAAPQQNGKASR
jgi:glycosyltransferase involved in cell wall biosynthesis